MLSARRQFGGVPVARQHEQPRSLHCSSGWKALENELEPRILRRVRGETLHDVRPRYAACAVAEKPITEEYGDGLRRPPPAMFDRPPDDLDPRGARRDRLHIALNAI